jgi:hypothetical protein
MPLLALSLLVCSDFVMGATKPPKFTPPRTYYLARHYQALAEVVFLASDYARLLE